MTSETTAARNEALFAYFSNDCPSLLKNLADLKAKNRSEAEKCASLLLRAGKQFPPIRY